MYHVRAVRSSCLEVDDEFTTSESLVLVSSAVGGPLGYV